MDYLISDNRLGELAANICRLARNIVDNGLSSDDKVIGIYLDGRPLTRALDIVFNSLNICPCYDDVLVSSKLEVIDSEKIGRLRGEPGKRFYVDRRAVTGKLGSMLKDHDPEAIYCVLEDRGKNADISASTEEVPWFDWPRRENGAVEMAKATAPIIGLAVKPKVEFIGSKQTIRYTYQKIDGPLVEEFYKRLNRAVLQANSKC